MRRIILAVMLVALPLALASCAPMTCETPEINITSFGGGMASGTVCGVNPATMRVVVYIQVRGQWWVKPYQNDPFTPTLFGRWMCDVNTGGVDLEATTVAAYVVQAGYKPALNSPPTGDNIIASDTFTR